MSSTLEVLQTALQHHQAGRLPEAESLCRQILQAQPTHPDALQLLGVIAHQVGRNDIAIDLLGRAIAANPTAAEAYYNLGLMLQREGRPEEAQAQYREALRLKPEYADAWNNLGNILREQGRLEEAVGHYRQALAFNPAYAEAYNNLGIVLQDQGRLDEAMVHYRQALTLKPGQADALNNLGSILCAQGLTEEAAGHYRQALALDPENSAIHVNLGIALREQGKVEEAIAHYRQALELNPMLAPAHMSLGDVLKDEGRTEEAAACYRQAFAIQPSDGLKIKLATMLPVILPSAQDVAAIRKRFEENVDALLKEELTLKDPIKEVWQTNFYLAYQGYNDRELQIKVARLYERACPKLSFIADHCRSATPTLAARKIRVGFISRLFWNHTVGLLMSGLIAQLSRERFTTVVISFPREQDHISEFISRHADGTLMLPSSLGEAHRRIAQERLDILFYTDIGMDPATYFLAFSRLAPVQCVAWGHPVTTGIRSIDYFMSSELLEPEHGDEHYSERLVRLKHMPTYYYKPAIPAQRSKTEFGLEEGRTAYLCPQSLFKFHPEFDELLAGVLRADPQGELVLIEGQCQHFTDMLASRFRRSFCDVHDRVRFLKRQTMVNFRGLLSAVDVILDPLHWSGGNTTYEALFLGTPIVTLPSEFMRGRVTYGCYKSMGMMDCVASTKEDYVKLAVRLGTDRAFHDATKQKILARNHVLYENRKVVTEYERFFLAALKASQVQTKKRALSGSGRKKRRASGDQK